MVILRRARQIRPGYEPHQCCRAGIDSAGWNLIAGKRLAAGWIDQLDRAGRKIAAPLGVSGDRRILVEDVVRPARGVIDLDIRAPIGIGIQPWNLEETAERSADRILCELRLRDRHVPPQLERRAVEDRSAEGVRRTSLIRTLTARAAAADYKRSAAARPEKIRVLRTEAGCELTGRRIELAEIDHLQSIVHQL